MIQSLDDAWAWYKSVRTLAYDMRRLAGKLDEPCLAAILGRDKNLRDATESDLVDRANTVLADLDDLAVLVLFSVFEVTVRARAKEDVDREMASVRHPAVLRAIAELKETIDNGSFGKITEAFRSMDIELTTQVNQVRVFRNWVAHGRRDDPKKKMNDVDPEAARDRLRRYLDRLTEIEVASSVPNPPIGNDPFTPPAPEPPSV